nr:retrotransposon protein, putative, Ty1-copia subclass [Tanacetum cinerariifolium]
LNFLSHLNLSHNNLSGRIPTGNQLQTLIDPSIYAGNRGLCGTPLEKSCSSHEDPTNTINKNKNDTDDEIELWFYFGHCVWFSSGFLGCYWSVVVQEAMETEPFHVCGDDKETFNNNIKRATDLLGLIHTDMYGPLRHVSRKGASYFLTFTDDFSHYGYVYLLKHKHKAFENFKVFKSEVELQLGKKIKALHFDRGGEYLSQEFKDYLKTMGYYFYFPPKNKVIVARYGNFLERDIISQKFSRRDNDLEDDHMDTLPSENTSKIRVESEILGSPSELIPVCRSERTTRAPNRLCLNIGFEDGEVGDLGEPANYKAFMLDPDKVIWQGAMNEEMKSMKVMKVWIAVDLPLNAKVVRSKWLYKKKTDMDGKVHTYKARLVAKGCTQTYGIDCEETFSPVADIRAIRILIVIAAYYDYEIWKMDVKTAFLNGRLDKDIYMEHPEGCVDPKYPNRVCKLQRSIYGLKQASRQWNKRFDEEIKKFGFIQNYDETCVYRKASRNDVVFLILYVDHILIMGNNIPRLKEVKDYLGKCFSMKDLGEAAYILGIKIYRDRSRQLIRLSQSAYIDKTLKKYNMHNSKKGYLPMEVKHDLSNELCSSTPEDVAYMKKVPYASAVGSIMYVVRCTRPDVAFAQILTGYVFVVNGGAVDWKSKKQTTIAMHSAQAEYVAASEATMEAVWIMKFVGDLGVKTY